MIIDWKTGEWYLAVRCRNCGVQFAFLRDGETDEQAYFTDSGRIVLTCLECYFPLAYSPHEIKRVQAK